MTESAKILALQDKMEKHAENTAEQFAMLEAKVDELLALSVDTKRLIELLKDVEGFLSVTAKIGKVLKWMFGLFAAAIGAYAAWKGLHK